MHLYRATGDEVSFVDNDNLLAYSKTREGDRIRSSWSANVDPHHTQSGWLQSICRRWVLRPRSVPGDEPAFGGTVPVAGTANYVSLDPGHSPAHIFRIRQRVRSEKDFDYFLLALLRALLMRCAQNLRGIASRPRRAAARRRAG